MKNLLYRPDYLKILKAELTIQPLRNSYFSNTPPPPELYAVTTNQLNNYGAVLLTPGSSGYQTGDLVTDPLYDQNTYYSYDVTAYLQQEILSATSADDGFLLEPPSPADITNLNRLIIGNQKNANGAIQLKLYYVSNTP